ncbi:MAG: hypothetical protein F4W93_00355 [Dehalococcoidia bacterium]|nr:hypothetical protein [Dehalococcoidia bacterium]
MTTLTIHLSQIQIEVLDEIMGGRRDYRTDDTGRGYAIGEILLKHHYLLGEREDRKGEAAAAQQALRDQLEALARERDAVREALDAERATRRRDRERHARTRERLRGARNALQRLAESRATYRDLALRVEAALERTQPRKDLGDLEGRLARALRAAGFTMRDAPDR